MPRRRTTPQADAIATVVGGDVLHLVPDRRPSLPLHDLEHVEREMARVFRDARSGRIRSDEGTRLVYMLASLAKVMEVRLIDRRLDDLEKMVAEASLRGPS